MKATISLRVTPLIWMNPVLLANLLAWMKQYHGTIEEVALFTAFTHPPLPLAEIKRRAALLAEVIPQFRALGLRTGINHLATLGHIDENLENSLREPWQHLVDVSGKVSAGCFCASDPAMQNYIRQCYEALAETGPDFIWLDDDVRLEWKPPTITCACFCDLCLAKFAEESGKSWTRETLVAAFSAEPLAERLALRRAWLQHNRDYISRILHLAREAADKSNPDMQLGLMSTEQSYSGYGFAQWNETMAGPRRVEVKWRPGSGFFTDDRPTELLAKAHSAGRQASLIPATTTDIQWELENFPYQVLKKSCTMLLAEITAAIGAGCTGTALNIMGIAADPFDEFRPYFDAVARTGPFFNSLVTAFGRSPCEGIWPAFSRNHLAALDADGQWPNWSWGGDLSAANELFELGLPPAYSPQKAAVTLLLGDAVLEWSLPELTRMLTGGVIMDGPALKRLEQLGLGDLAGFTVSGTKERDTLERFTADPLNGVHAGWHRDCRPSFWQQNAYLLKPLAAASRPLAEVIDFTPVVHGCCAGVYENRLGGRVAVFGYYPWSALQCLGKATQMKAVCRWLSKDSLPAFTTSFHRLPVWCRRDAVGQPAFLLLNASIDAAKQVTLQIRTKADTLQALDMDGKTTLVKTGVQDGEYRGVTLPTLPPWSALLLRSGG
jgi:hypothetical protein